jgi:hypothetical protein
MIGRFALLTLLPLAWADSQGRPNLNGNWRLEPSQCEMHSRVPGQLTWQIEQDDTSIHLVQRTEEKKNGDDIRCATDGKDCKTKAEGRSVVLNFYYNGPVLIELETEGHDNVVKKRLHLSNDGSTLIVDVTHVSPPGKPTEKLVLTRQ